MFIIFPFISCCCGSLFRVHFTAVGFILPVILKVKKSFRGLVGLFLEMKILIPARTGNYCVDASLHSFLVNESYELSSIFNYKELMFHCWHRC